MSHTKQTPILNYSTADLPTGKPAGTAVFNTDENCLNYYNGTEWVTSNDWESTYTTVGTYSAVWNSAPSVFDADAAVYVSSNGSDIHDGRSMDKPKVTISQAIPVADDLITDGATGVRIEVLDGGSYGSSVDEIVVGDKMHLYAPNATYTGKVNIFGGSSVTFDKHFSPNGTPANALNTQGIGSSYYKSNLLSSGDNETSVLIYHNIEDHNLHIDVKSLFVRGRGGPAGVQVSKGKAFLDINSIILEGVVGSSSVYGLYISGGYITGNIGSIKDSSLDSSTDNKGIGLTSGNSTDVYLRVGEINTDIPYQKPSSSSRFYLDCLNINATPEGGGSVGVPDLEISNLTYNNADWDSTYTTVSANSGIWDNSAALAYNDGNTNSIEIGILDSTTETGPNAITIQGSRGLVTQVASGTNSIAIGTNTKAEGDQAVVIGIGSQATDNNGTAVGSNTIASASHCTAIGTFSKAEGGFGSCAFGTSVLAGGAGSLAYGYTCQAKQSKSAVFGRNVINNTANTAEIGWWSGTGNSDRRGAVRMDSQRNVSFSIKTTAVVMTDGGSQNGSEAANTLGRQMIAFRRNGNDFYLDANDSGGNITTVTLGGSNSQQTITSSAGTLTLDVSLGQSATTTLTEDITTFTIQNASAGDSGVLIISSDGGGWTFPDQNSLGASHIIHTGSPDSISTLTSTASSAVSIGWYCDGSRQFLYISDPT